MIRKQRYLSKQEAGLIGIKPKENEKGRNKARYLISNEDYSEVLSERLNKRSSKLLEVEVRKDKDGNVSGTVEKLRTSTIEDVPEGFEIVKLSTNKSSSQQWVISKPIEDKGVFEADFDYFKALEKELKKVKKHKPIVPKKGREGVVTITDLHFGAYIEGLNITPEYNITILCEKLQMAAYKVNRLNYDVVHVHLLGDLIESFTGLNHKNSWKGLQKGMFGVKAIKLFVELFIKHFLTLINNLQEIKVVAGNHDRVTSDNKEDADGGAAELIAWGLENRGYKIEFNRSIITHKIGNINHILGHGHLFMMMKKTTQELCWIYGEKGCFNYIKEGHLHSRIRKLNAKQLSNFKMLQDDNIDCRREVIASIFTGNQHSEDGGWSTMAGFSVSEENKYSGGVDVYDFSL